MAKRYVTRKCYACKQEIPVDKKNITGIVFYKNNYYHKDCFCNLAEENSKKTKGKPQEWKDALDNIDELEKKTKVILTSRIAYRGATDDLNDYLLSQYNVIEIESRFWQVIGDLSNGLYKGKRCKKVSVETILGAWKWGQHKLNEINKQNKMNHKGPENDDQRIPYDLAILVRKIPNYLAYKAKQDVLQAETVTSTPRIDYNNLYIAEVKREGLGDISDLLDDDDE